VNVVGLSLVQGGNCFNQRAKRLQGIERLAFEAFEVMRESVSVTELP